MTKMEKAKIEGMSSEEYPEGRIDVFRIPISENIVYPIEEIFKDLGFSQYLRKKYKLAYSPIY